MGWLAAISQASFCTSLWAAQGWLPLAASSPIFQLLHPQIWFGQQRQQQRIHALETVGEGKSREKGRGKGRDGGRTGRGDRTGKGGGDRRKETEKIGSVPFLLPGWILLSNSPSCSSSQVLGSTHFPRSNGSAGWTGHKANVYLLLPECLTSLLDPLILSPFQ